MTSYRKKKALLKEYGIEKPVKDPAVNPRIFDYSDKFSKMQLCFISDVHIGTSDSDIEGLIDNLKYASQQENAKVFFLGDMMNAAILGSKSDVYEESLSPQDQMDLFTKILTYAQGNFELPAYLMKLLEDNKIFLPEDSLKYLGKQKSNIATINEGNHEARITKSVGISPTKVVAETAGVDAAFSPYFSNTEIILKNNFDNGESISFKIVGHHGTGNNKIDDMVNKYTKQVNNADFYVMGHIHDNMLTTKRMIDLQQDKETGEEKQVYRDVHFLTLPASGGGSYAAGMSLPRRHKNTAVWLEIEPQLNPLATEISATGVTQPKYVTAVSFISPDINQNPNRKMAKSVRQAKRIIKRETEQNLVNIIENDISDTLDAIDDYSDNITDAIIETIKVKPLKEPKGFREYYEEKQSQQKQQNNQHEQLENENEMEK